jgi:hypothetical protein
MYFKRLFVVIFSIKKLESAIRNRSITPKQFMIYSFYVLGPILSLIKISKYPVNIAAYNMAYILSFIPVFINIIKYICCYKIIKEKNIFNYLYSIIPLNFVLNLRYLLFLMIPLVLINHYLIKYFNLEFNYWNVVGSAIITIIFQIFIAIHLIAIIKRLYKSTILPYGEMVKYI